MHRITCLVLCAACTSPLCADEEIIYDSMGFESFENGFLGQDGLGQDGWFGWAADGGWWPRVISGPPCQDERCVWLRIHFSEGAGSTMSRDMGDLVAEGYTRVTVAFDVYRPSPQVLWFPAVWWGWLGDYYYYGTPIFGAEEPDGPLSSRTYPFLVDPETDEWAATRADQWSEVRLTWDLRAGAAFGYYNDVLVSEIPISNPVSLITWYLSLAHGESPDGFHYEDAWIDNFIITGEKAGCYPDCDGSGGLDLFDFLCFVGRFNAGEDDADCDGDGAIGLFDFFCFVNAFNGGC